MSPGTIVPGELNGRCRRYWTWKDGDKMARLKFTNWAKDEPKSGTMFAAMTSDGKWYSSNSTRV